MTELASDSEISVPSILPPQPAEFPQEPVAKAMRSLGGVSGVSGVRGIARGLTGVSLHLTAMKALWGQDVLIPNSS